VKSKVLPTEWSERAINSAVVIREYIEQNFSVKEVDSFYELLESFEKAVSVFPRLYPFSKNKLRKAVLSYELSVVYKIQRKKIYIVDVIDNRSGRTY
jgi:hypothetical protein